MATQETLKVGDIVKLKSGGPRMTVGKVVAGGNGVTCLCSWFVERESKDATFSQDALNKINFE